MTPVRFEFEIKRHSRLQRKGRRSPSPAALVAILVAAVCVAGCSERESAGDSGRTARAEVTVEQDPAPHRVVWVRKLEKPRDTWLFEADGRLMAFDSEAGGKRILLPGPERFLRPLFTPDGGWVVFSTTKETGRGAGGFMVERVRWDGSERETIAPGVAVDARRDSDGHTWLYVARQIGAHGNYTAQRIERLALDDPGREPELVWDRGPVTLDNIQISADGRWMSGTFPWPEAGRVDLESGRLEPMEQGCWPSMAPDESGLMWVFDGRHRNVRLMLGDQVRPVRINDAESVQGFEVYHPRWSNHPRYLVATGPYLIGETDVRITGGGEAVGILMGRFDSGLTEVEQWWRISGDEAADFYPDLWVSGGEGRELDMELVRSADTGATRLATPSLGEGWPPSGEGLLLRMEHTMAPNQWRDHEGNTLRLLVRGVGDAVLADDRSLQPRGGAFVMPATLGESLAASARETNQFTWSALVTAEDAVAPEAARLFSLSTGGDERNFSIDQVGDRWIVRWRTMWSRDSAADTDVDIGPVTAGSPAHFVISYAEPELKVWINGEPGIHRRGRNRDLGNWTPQGVIIGNEWGGGAPWRGRVQGLLWYDRALAGEEARALFTAMESTVERIEAKAAPAGALKVRARLIGANPIPTIEDIHPYESHLEVFSWLVEDIVEGSAGIKGSEIEVLQWVILNGTEVPGSRMESGAVRNLRLVPAADQWQLEGASQGMPQVDRMHLPLYYRNESSARDWQGVPGWDRDF